MIPHVIRLVAGASYRRLLPLSLMFGAAFLILADIPGRMLTNPAETPIGVVTAFIGAPFFIYLLRTRRVPVDEVEHGRVPRRRRALRTSVSSCSRSTTASSRGSGWA